MTFRGEVLPATIRAFAVGNPRAAATTLSTAALALPRSAGAFTRTLSVSPSQPAMPSREDPGTTLIGSLMGRSPFAVEIGGSLVLQGNDDLSAAELVYRISGSYAETRDAGGHLDAAERACERLIPDVRVTKHTCGQNGVVRRDDFPGVRVVAPALVVVSNRYHEAAHRSGAVRRGREHVGRSGQRGAARDQGGE